MNDRIKFTENELRVMKEHPEADRVMFMGDDLDLNSLIKRENARKAEDEVNRYQEAMEKKEQQIQESQDSLSYDINKAEIKPVYSRILVKPFERNPFQRIVRSDSGLIIDSGSLDIHAELNPNTGKYEQQQEFIVTGCVQEVGPETKYLKPGDVVFYRRDTAVPVPFFKSGFVSLAENQVICTVNESLTERFEEAKDPVWVDLAEIPEELGSNLEERIAKWIEFKKHGIMLKNSNSGK